MFTRKQMNRYRIGSSVSSTDLARRAVLACLMAAVPVAALSVLTPAAFGQASSSSDIAGKVTDSSGATVPGATVQLTNNGTGAQRTTTTNDSDTAILVGDLYLGQAGFDQDRGERADCVWINGNAGHGLPPCRKEPA